MTLKDSQQRFIEEYLVDNNGTQAAIRAGYSVNTAASQASRLLRNAQVRAALDAAIAEQSERTGITADRVLQEYADLAFADPHDAAALNAKVRALDALGKHLGLFRENLNVSVAVEHTIPEETARDARDIIESLSIEAHDAPLASPPVC